MAVIRWRANAGRRYPQYTLPAESTEVYGNQSIPPGDFPTGTVTLSRDRAMTGAAIREHYDIGTETDYLYLLPTLTVTASLETHDSSGTLRLQPAVSSVSYIGRVGTGTLQLVPGMTAQAHTETGGNVSGSGALSFTGALSGTAIIDHLTPVVFTVQPYLTVSAQIGKLATGTLQLVPYMQGNSITTGSATLRLEPTLSGEGYIRVQSGIWVVIPESGGGWTTQ